MIIYELDGYKYLGFHPSYPKSHRNLRKNLTYVSFKITDWEKDKKMLNFLSTHMDADRVEALIHLIENKVVNNKTSKLYFVIRQDDDIEESYGHETMMLTNKKPKNIDSFILKGKMFIDKIENSY